MIGFQAFDSLLGNWKALGAVGYFNWANSLLVPSYLVLAVMICYILNK